VVTCEGKLRAIKIDPEFLAAEGIEMALDAAVIAANRPLGAADKLVENIRAFTDAVTKAKPSGAKGHYINRVSISSTMGPGVKVDMSTLVAAVAEK